MTKANLAALAPAQRREAAFAGVLQAAADGGSDLDQVLFAIAGHATELCGGVSGCMYFEGVDTRCPMIMISALGPRRQGGHRPLH